MFVYLGYICVYACSNANRQGPLPECFLLNLAEYAITHV